MERALVHFDRHAIGMIRKIAIPAARGSLFIIFFYFGLLKVLAVSPADPLVAALLAKTMPFISFDSFNLFLGIFEMMIGILFLVPGDIARLTFLLLVVQMSTTFLPLVMLPDMTWHTWGVPTLEGQYIIKNLLIIALSLGIVAHIHPFTLKDLKK